MYLLIWYHTKGCLLSVFFFLFYIYIYIHMLVLTDQSSTVWHFLREEKGLKTYGSSLVTQPMSQLWPNRSELRSMDYYHQIFCRFRKCKRKVPPPSPLSTQKLPFTPPKEDFSHHLGGGRGGVKGWWWRNFSLTFSEST